MSPFDGSYSGVLWVDLRVQQKVDRPTKDCKYLSFSYSRLRDEEFFEVLEHGRFGVFIFQYDAPMSTTLRLLERVKSKHPSCPIIMVTEQHSEALAVWALRTRVWEYFVEPVNREDIDDAVRDVLAIKRSDSTRRSGEREQVTRLRARPSDLKRDLRKDLVGLAGAYIQKNFHRDITLKDVAEHLCVSYSYLSRLFKRNSVGSFNDLLWNARIAAAQTLLLDDHASVTTVCYEVGCNNPGYFATKFRAKIQMSPTEYKNRAKLNKSNELAANIGQIVR